MWVIGITGSFAMGKSTVLRQARFAAKGARYQDSDAVVHKLLGKGGAAVAPVSEAFPKALKNDGSICRKTLGGMVFGDDEKLNALEAILLPMVRQKNEEFLQQCMRARARIVLLEIPLMFETGANALCDEVWVASANAMVQRQRGLRRAGMTADKMQAILSRQMPDAQKRKLADAIIPTSLGKGYSMRVIKTLLAAL